MPLSRRAFVALLPASVLLTAAVPALAAPSAELWPRWTAHDPASTLSVDHAAWDAFLATYVVVRADGANRVDYARVTPADKAALGRYIRALEATPVSKLARPQQRAYWINLYNAVTVATVLKHYPVTSIRDIDISPGWFSDGPWGAKLVTVEGEKLSLDDIEHRILRPIWRDPRIHYAVNCAALGCPSLLARAYRADDMDRVLTANARAYVNDPRGARVEAGGGIVVSSIYEWFKADFGGTDRGVLAHLRKYAEGETASALAAARGIDGDAYDWTLNDVTRR